MMDYYKVQQGSNVHYRHPCQGFVYGRVRRVTPLSIWQRKHEGYDKYTTQSIVELDNGQTIASRAIFATEWSQRAYGQDGKALRDEDGRVIYGTNYMFDPLRGGMDERTHINDMLGEHDTITDTTINAFGTINFDDLVPGDTVYMQYRHDRTAHPYMVREMMKTRIRVQAPNHPRGYIDFNRRTGIRWGDGDRWSQDAIKTVSHREAITKAEVDFDVDQYAENNRMDKIAGRLAGYTTRHWRKAFTEDEILQLLERLENA